MSVKFKNKGSCKCEAYSDASGNLLIRVENIYIHMDKFANIKKGPNHLEIIKDGFKLNDVEIILSGEWKNALNKKRSIFFELTSRTDAKKSDLNKGADYQTCNQDRFGEINEDSACFECPVFGGNNDETVYFVCHRDFFCFDGHLYNVSILEYMRATSIAAWGLYKSDSYFVPVIVSKEGQVFAGSDENTSFLNKIGKLSKPAEKYDISISIVKGLSMEQIKKDAKLTKNRNRSTITGRKHFYTDVASYIPNRTRDGVTTRLKRMLREDDTTQKFESSQNVPTS